MHTLGLRYPGTLKDLNSLHFYLGCRLSQSRLISAIVILCGALHLPKLYSLLIFLLFFVSCMALFQERIDGCGGQITAKSRVKEIVFQMKKLFPFRCKNCGILEMLGINIKALGVHKSCDIDKISTLQTMLLSSLRVLGSFCCLIRLYNLRGHHLPPPSLILSFLRQGLM